MSDTKNIDQGVGNIDIKDLGGELYWKEREARTRAIIEKAFPKPDFLEKMARINGVEKDKLGAGSREQAMIYKVDFERSIETFIIKVSHLDVPLEDLEEFFNQAVALMDIGGEYTFGSKLSAGHYIPNHFFDRYKSVESTRFCLQVFEDWSRELNKEKSPIKQEVVDKIFRKSLDVVARIGNGGEGEKIKYILESIKKVIQHCFDLPKSMWEYYLVSFGEAIYSEVESGCKGTMENVLQLFEEFYNSGKHNKHEMLFDVYRYSRVHGLSEAGTKGFRKNIFQGFIGEPNKDVKVLRDGGNIWATRKGEVGVADFICHCQVSEATPGNINELMAFSREIPTSDFHKFEQNRSDAYRVADFGIKDLIHYQRPNLHPLLLAMVKFYDAGDKQGLEEACKKVDTEISDKIFDRNIYDKVVGKNFGEEQKERKVIDVLRRLVKNTEPIPLEPPITENKEWDELMQECRVDSGEVVSVVKLEKLLEFTNQQLKEWIKEKKLGFKTDEILALSYIERQCFAVLGGIKFEEQTGVYKEKWFREILLFEELTASAGVDFDEENFNKFLEKLDNPTDQSISIDRPYVVAYRLIGDRVLKNCYDLAMKYKPSGNKDRVDAVWSGNIAHELLDLGGPRPADTTLGKRFQEEQSRSPWERLSGD